MDGQAVPSCRLPVQQVVGLPIVTVEGLGTAEALHPLQEAFIAEQAIQCGYCTAGMIMAAQGLLNRMRYPTDDEIRTALADNLCRCGVYDRVRRAIKLRIGRPEPEPIYEVRPAEAVEPGPPPALPRVLQQTPDLDRWIQIHEDETITIFTGKVDYGQGIRTALAQIVAEELDVPLERIRVVMADTALTPDEGMTTGSMSLETSGLALRWAAAAARHLVLSVAYEALEAPRERLVIEDGVIRDPVSGRRVTYGQLWGGRPFGHQITGSILPKAPGAHRLLGQPAERLDLLPKVTGVPTYIHDLELPAMVHGRVLRPPHPQAQLVSVDTAAVANLPGVIQVVQDGRFLAVIAEREEQAIHAVTLLGKHVVWEGDARLPPAGQLYHDLFAQPDQPLLIVDGTAVDAPIPPAAPPPPHVAQTLQTTYYRPYQMHASLGPSAAVAHYQDGRLTIWTQAQGVFPPRAAIAHVLGMNEADIHVIYREGAGCYGHNGADDAALDAALLARSLPGRPISLKWLRADEHGWEPYAPAMKIALQASLDGTGAIIDWQQDIWSLSHLGRPRSAPGVSGLLAASHLAQPFAPPPAMLPRGSHSGSYRNADPLYHFAQKRIITHHLPTSPLRVSAMRGLGAVANVFAIESFMDELALAANADPVAFRLRHLTDERARAIIEAAADKAGWRAGGQSPAPGHGRGLGFGQYKNRQAYTAVIVDLHVDDSGEIHLDQAVIAADAGQIVNADGLSNQLEGGFIQAASLALYEQVTWDENGITSRDWQSYPILRFPQAPPIATVLLNRPDQPFVGAGEASLGPTVAAIANALFAATGRRGRSLPLTVAGRDLES